MYLVLKFYPTPQPKAKMKSDMESDLWELFYWSKASFSATFLEIVPLEMKKTILSNIKFYISLGSIWLFNGLVKWNSSLLDIYYVT